MTKPTEEMNYKTLISKTNELLAATAGVSASSLSIDDRTFAAELLKQLLPLAEQGFDEAELLVPKLYAICAPSASATKEPAAKEPTEPLDAAAQEALEKAEKQKRVMADLENASAPEVHNVALALYQSTNDPAVEDQALALFDLAAKKGLVASRKKAEEIRKTRKNR